MGRMLRSCEGLRRGAGSQQGPLQLKRKWEGGGGSAAASSLGSPPVLPFFQSFLLSKVPQLYHRFPDNQTSQQIICR